jgi:hypothetical protein
MEEKKLETNLRWLKENMPSFDEEDERRIREFVIPLIVEGTTEEDFREKATRKDPDWSGRDFFLFTLLTQEDLPKFIQETQAENEKVRKKIINEGDNYES